MSIRPATPADFPAVLRIINDLVDTSTITFTTVHKTPDDLAAMVARGAFFVATDADDIAQGYASYGPFRAGPGYAHVAEVSLALSPKAKGQGQGRALIAALAALAPSQGVRILMSGISASNAPGRAFHAACGFVEVGHLAGVGHKFGQSLDLVLAQKTLAKPPASP